MRGSPLCWLPPLVALAVLLTLAGPSAGENPTWRWYELDARKDVRINLYVFWSSRCGNCTRAIEYLNGLQRTYPWLQITYYETSAHPGNVAFYQSKAAAMGRVAGQVPAFFYCNELDIGFDSAETTGARIERTILRWRIAVQQHLRKRSAAGAIAPIERAALAWLPLVALQAPAAADEDLPELPLDLPPEEPIVRVPWWGEMEASDLSLPLLTITLAGCDAFNPCAFFVLLFLLSLLLHGHSRSRLLLVGGLFVFCSGLVYFLFMAAWLNLFFVVGHLRVITLAAGVVAVLVALVNIKDFFRFRQGVTLSIPEGAKPGLYQRMTGLIRQTSFLRLVAGTLVLATVVNLYELLCTSGFPMVFTRVLTLRHLPTASYYLYLLLYNLIYILPLALIVLVFSLTLGGHKLSEYEGRVLKLLSGLMMLALGVLLLAAPELLSRVAGAVATLTLAVGLTGLIVLLDWGWRRAGLTGKGPPAPRQAA